MPIIQYPGYISKEEAARRKKVQLRTIAIHINKKRIGFEKIDDRIFIKNITSQAAPSAGIALGELEWVTNFAARHHITTDRIYEQIIMNKITGVIVADRVFVMRNEPALLSFIAGVTKNRK